ncbi:MULTISPECIES: hypothetical protein [unclassified Moorena]|uniref:hypothetical protein n=1 Tax=unclassified Moorena TaxID=2683338 RepID=UPI0013FF7296|nr:MULTISPECIES: hypothetical protein [unclassified Moorena]NEO13965.1 hypothetical protein [Moorena sp. SIO3E8]NEQ00027.1 hypothetical protein [Moorena sp. SIO3F7]
MDDLNYYLDKYDAIPLDTDQYKNSYVGWALDFFIDETKVINPYLDITLRLYLTDAETNYNDNFKNDYSTFTCFLIWKLLKALKKHPSFWWRFINDKWYQINNPPLFCPTAVGGKARFLPIIINNATKLGWLEFSELYKNTKDSIFANPIWSNNRDISYAYQLCQFVGNLPGLDFISFAMQTGRESTQSFFYFGKRTYDENKQTLTVPLAIKFHHSNLDPFLIELLVKDYLAELSKL